MMIKSTLKIARCSKSLGDSGFLQFFRLVSSDDKANPVVSPNYLGTGIQM